MKHLLLLVAFALVPESKLLASEMVVDGVQIEIEAPKTSTTPHGKTLVTYTYYTSIKSDPFDKNPAFIKEIDGIFEKVREEAESLGASHVWIKPKSKTSPQPYKEYKFSRTEDGSWAPVLDQFKKR